jgi:hypothetical protein
MGALAGAVALTAGLAVIATASRSEAPFGHPAVLLPVFRPLPGVHRPIQSSGGSSLPPSPSSPLPSAP